MVSSTKSLRILQIGMGWFPEQPGGLDRVYYEVCNRLQNLPEVALHGLVAGSPRVAEQSRGAIRAFASANTPLPQRLWAARNAIQKTLRTFQPNLIASHFALYTFPALDVLKGKPFVVHFHGPWAMEGSAENERDMATRLKKGLEKRVYQKAQHFIVLSKAFQEVLAQQYGIPKDRVHIVPGGIEVERYADLAADKEEARRQLGWPLERPIALVVRRLRRRMGLEMLLHSLAQLKEAFPQFLVLIAGKGPLSQELETLIQQLGLHNQARLLGFLPDEQLPIAYRAADFTIVPTVALEGFGLITIESLAAGTPVLVTPIGGLPEVIRPFRPEWVTEAATEEALTERLRAVLSGQIPYPPALECQEYVKQNFDWSVILPKIVQVYTLAANDHGSAAQPTTGEQT
jgi:glycogen(starch) synthase